MPKTLLGWTNFLFIQWTGFRLARIIDEGEQTHWAVVGPVVPLTGWWNNYWGQPTVRCKWTS